MHGTADKSVPFEGRASQRKGTPRFYQSVEASVEFWKSQNGCTDASPRRQLLSGDAAQLTKWSDCTSGNPVWLITLKGWEHIWPGPYFTAKLTTEDPFKDFDAAEIIWDFFSRRNGDK
jgi:polyhydroxybutyrate depolymerase